MPDASNAGCVVTPTGEPGAPHKRRAIYRSRVTLLDPRQESTSPAPLFTFRLPPDLNGSTGTNRSVLRTTLGWSDDLSAIYAFLDRFPTVSAGFCRYRREIERFLLWMVFERCKPLSSADEGDCRHYLSFLDAPKGVLVGPRARRFNTRWYPFSSGGLGETAKCHATMALRATFEYLVKNQYLRANPWDIGYAAMRNDEPERVLASAFLTPEVWNAIVASLRDRVTEADIGASRTALATLLLVRDAQLNLATAAVASTGDLQHEPGHGICLDVRRRYGRRRSIELRPETVEALEAQWSDCNAPGLLARLPTSPLLRIDRPVLPACTDMQRARAARAASEVLYAVLERALREVYPELERRLGEHTPAVHGVIQAVDAMGSR